MQRFIIWHPTATVPCLRNGAPRCKTCSFRPTPPQGVFNGLSAGILLYVGFSMAAEDFSREDVVRDGRLTLSMIACICTAAAAMSLLGLWS